MNNNNADHAATILIQHGQWDKQWLERLTAHRTGPMSVSLVAQKAKAVYAETLLCTRGSSEDVFMKLEAAR